AVTGTGTDSLTYAQLDAHANRLAHLLRRAGAGPELPVGVWLERSPQMVVALLAILKAGSAYVPLDPDVPPARPLQTLGDARTPLVCSTAELAHHFTGSSITPLTLDQAGAMPDTPLATPIQPLHPVSIYYTSGSTGTPKGVVSSHRGWVN